MLLLQFAACWPLDTLLRRPMAEGVMRMTLGIQQMPRFTFRGSCAQ
jgi:hypothetical protein